MRRAGWVVLLLVGLASFVAAAQTDCGCVDASAPTCYTTFRSNEIIDFQLIVPLDFYWMHNTTETPLITAWRVETLEGVLVKYVPQSEPKGHWATFSWDLTDDYGCLVDPGFYRIIVSSPLTGDVFADVEIISCCCWSCWGCCPSPCYCPWINPCIPACGQAYLKLANGGTRNCCTFHLTIYAEPVTP
jgi:hypothetical protein